MKVLNRASLMLVVVGVVSAGGGNSPLVESARRRIRALSYPEESLLGLFFALALPLDDPRSSKSVNVAFFFEANYKLPDDEDGDADEEGRRRRRRAIDRTTLYRALEAKFDSLGMPGRQCLLRAICETARDLRPEHRHNGLVGDLMRISLTPSTSESEQGAASDYELAEEHGGGAADCASIYRTCPFSIYQHITAELAAE